MGIWRVKLWVSHVIQKHDMALYHGRHTGFFVGS